MTERLLGHLHHEARLLHTSKDCLLGVHAALRAGNLPGLQDAQPQQEQLAADLRAAAAGRTAAADEMAAALGLPAGNVALSDLADRLPPKLAGQLRAVRDALRAVVADVVELQRANANLVFTLRSYFHGVLSGLASADAPATTRYGPTGSRLQAVTP